MSFELARFAFAARTLCSNRNGQHVSDVEELANGREEGVQGAVRPILFYSFILSVLS